MGMITFRAWQFMVILYLETNNKWEFILNSVLLDIFINSLGKDKAYTHIKFSNYYSFVRTAGRMSVARILDRLTEWAKRNLINTEWIMQSPGPGKK